MQRKRSSQDSRSNRHCCRPFVEELEPRNLLSAVYYNPIQIATAYGFPVGSGSAPGAGETIAIVDAYNDPTIINDVQTFDAHVNDAFPTINPAWPGGSPVPALTPVQAFVPGATSQLMVVNQTGGAIKNQTSTRRTTPPYNASWDVEIALDVEWSHAMAPGANILLVEANSNSFSNLLTAVKYAAGHAQVVSMSWGANELSGEIGYDATFAGFAGMGVTFVASSGDSGAPIWPAVSPDVVGVGGTILTLTNLGTSGVYSNETGWSGSGGGVSKYETLPSYQTGLGTTNGPSTTNRNSPDVAYDSGSSNSYVLVYDSGNWYGVYGTSAGAPQWAALFAITDQGLALAGSKVLDATQTLPGLYQLPSSDFHDITSGSNAGYTAGPGYDLVTGLGSPIASSVIAGLITYAKANPASATPFRSTVTGGPVGAGNSSDSAVDILATAGVRTPISNGPASRQASLLTVSAVQKLATPPLEVVPTSFTVASMGGSLPILVAPAPGGIASATPRVLSNGFNSAGGVVAGWPNSAVNDHGTMSLGSPTSDVSVGDVQADCSAWSSALLLSTQWGSSTDFDATGWPIYSALPAEDACIAGCEARREENSSPGAAAFAVTLGIMAWCGSLHTNLEPKRNNGTVLR